MIGWFVAGEMVVIVSDDMVACFHALIILEMDWMKEETVRYCSIRTSVGGVKSRYVRNAPPWLGLWLVLRGLPLYKALRGRTIPNSCLPVPSLKSQNILCIFLVALGIQLK